MRELLGAPGLVGASDAVRLAVVVLAARTPEATGRVEIRAGELARWLGMSKSYVASVVLPGLRRSGVVRTFVVEGEFGEDRAVACEVVPLWEARGLVGHPLALSRMELAVLLRLCEALFAPGWAHRDGSVTPAGLLGSRTGRGAATDRLALLLLVLAATESGRVRLCGGAVDARRGRAAATVARLLGCTVYAGERVLERLGDAGLVVRVRRETASGMAHRSRLVVSAVAAAHRPGGVPAVQESRVRAVGPGFSDPDGAAGGSDRPEPDTEEQVNGAQETVEAGAGEPDVTAALHTDHSCVADEVVDGAGSGGFSGEAASGCCQRPECACVREDQADGSAGAGRLTLVGGPGGPLRGDKPEESATNEHQEPDLSQGQPGRGAAAGLLTAVGTGSSRQQRGRVPRPPRDLEMVFGVVGPVWARLEREGARRKVIDAARRELAAIAGVAGDTVADQLLVDRLMRRLAVQGGPAAVTDPVGWLLGRGLPRWAECGDLRCDEGLRMDTGGACETCACLLADRRDLRHQVAAKVDADLPGAGEEERRAVYERRLCEQTARDAELAAITRERAAAECVARLDALDRARAADEAADQVQQAVPCADCRAPGSAGLCVPCGDRRRTRELVQKMTLMVAAAWADVLEPSDVDVVIADTETTIRVDLEQACAAARAQGATPDTLALLARLAAENAATDYHRSALALLARSPVATAEAQQASEAVMRSRHRYPSRAAARAAAAKARQRTAEHLLATRMATVRAQRRAETGAVPAADCAPTVYRVGAARARAAMRARLVGSA